MLSKASLVTPSGAPFIAISLLWATVITCWLMSTNGLPFESTGVKLSGRGSDGQMKTGIITFPTTALPGP